MKISLFKIGLGLTLIGIFGLAFAFVQGDKISNEIVLKPSNSFDINLELYGAGIAYYKIIIPQFSNEKIFVQVLDKNRNVIDEQIVQTKMSVGYFKFDNSGSYTVKIINPSETQLDLQVESGDTNSETMILPGVILLVGAILMIVTSYFKLKNYKIEHPEENIS